MARFGWLLALAVTCVLSLVGGVVLTYASVIAPRGVELSVDLPPTHTRSALVHADLAGRWSEAESVTAARWVTMGTSAERTSRGAREDDSRVSTVALEAEVADAQYEAAFEALVEVVDGLSTRNAWQVNSRARSEGFDEEFRASTFRRFREGLNGRSGTIEVIAAAQPGRLFAVIVIADDD